MFNEENSHMSLIKLSFESKQRQIPTLSYLIIDELKFIIAKALQYHTKHINEADDKIFTT